MLARAFLNDPYEGGGNFMRGQLGEYKGGRHFFKIIQIYLRNNISAKFVMGVTERRNVSKYTIIEMNYQFQPRMSLTPSPQRSLPSHTGSRVLSSVTLISGLAGQSATRASRVIDASAREFPTDSSPSSTNFHLGFVLERSPNISSSYESFGNCAR